MNRKAGEIWRRLLFYLRRDRFDREMAAEMRFHLEMKARAKRRAGMHPDAARSASHRQFGNVTLLHERSRDMWAFRWLDQLSMDLRYALRSLIKNPGYSAVAILTLALGIGANTAIFSVVNSVLLRLPYPDADRLFTLKSNQSVLDLEEIRAQAHSFRAIGGLNIQALSYTGGSEPLQVDAGLVDGDLFQVLGVQAAMGRTLTPEDNEVGAPPVTLVSHAFWKDQLGADPAVVGRVIPLSGGSYTLVGVMPSGFRMPANSVDLWTAVRAANPVAAQFRGVHFLKSYFLLASGATPVEARAEIEQMDGWLSQQYPEYNRGRQSRLLPLREVMTGDIQPALVMLVGAVCLVLLIACTNFANLMLARLASRQHEMMIRMALGAGRWRTIRQILTESLVLSLIGGAAGLAVARIGILALLAIKPEKLPIHSEVRMDGLVLAFTLVISLAAGIAFGLIPAAGALRLNFASGLKEGSRTTAGSASRNLLRRVLVAAETAIALVLVIGAGLLIRGFLMINSVDPGFKSDNLLTMRIELPEARYKEIPKQMAFRDRLMDDLNSLPRVHAAMVSELPLSGDFLDHEFVIEGRPPAPAGAEPALLSRTVTHNYFDTMKIPMLKGRALAATDRQDSPTVGVVNESFVRQYFSDADPIGARIRWARQEPPNWMEIVGVVADVKHFGLDQRERPAFYAAYDQLDQPWKRWMYVVVRSDRGTADLLPELKQTVARLDSQLPLASVRPMTDVIARSVAARRFNMVLMGSFAVVALIFASIGIYGVTSYLATQRTHEIGIRAALGAGHWDVIKLVVGEAALTAVAGAGVGLAAALGLTQLMKGLLYGVSPGDPLTFVLVTVLLIGISLAAAYGPARRASRLDPLSALRYE